MLCGVEHPVENVQQRAEGWERGRPITIGANCWFDPGAVVNEDIPPEHPCRRRPSTHDPRAHLELLLIDALRPHP